jgi:hypothetical protein
LAGVPSSCHPVYRRLRLSCCSAPQTRRLQKKLRSTRSVCLTQRLRPSRPAAERSAMCLTRFQPCASSLLKPLSPGFVDAPVVVEALMTFDTVRLGGKQRSGVMGGDQGERSSDDRGARFRLCFAFLI